jgi:DNA polymerase III subunit gamma/tau
LLKTLEEPPPHAIFILATTELHKIPATVTSRCQRFVFRRIPVKEMMARLRALCEQENLNVEEAALEMIARQATGALRDAISLLDQLVSSDSVVTLARAQELLGTASGQAVLAIVEALSNNDTAAGLNALGDAVDTGTDPRQLARQMTDYLRGLMLVRTGNAGLVEATTEARQTMAAQAQRFEIAALLRAIRAFTVAANDVRGGWQPQLPLELALVESTTPLPTSEAAAPSAPTPSPASAVGAAPRANPSRSTPKSATPALAPSVAAPVAPAPGPGPVDVKSVWTQLLALMREKDKATHGLLNSSKVLGLESNVLRLSSNEFVAKQFNGQAKTRQLINALLTQVVGSDCSVKCEVVGRARASANDDIPADGLVSTALGLGGEIVE